MQVLDYSEGFPGAAAIAEAGYGGAVRYIGFPGNPKCTTAEELDDFTEHELGMALVFEWDAGSWRGGRGAAQDHARWARAHADAIGFPADRPIYFAVDQDVVLPWEFDLAMEYLQGACDVLGVELVGVYGEHDVVARAAADAVASYFWQCRAWSGTPVRIFENRTLFQHYGDGNNGPAPVVGGVQCDINDVLVPDWGQHNGGNDMGLTQAEQTALLEGAAAVREGKENVRPAGELYLLTYENSLRLQRIEAQNAELLGRPPADVDEAALAAELLRLGLGRELGRLPLDQLKLLSTVTADEIDRRARARANTNVPPAETGQ